MITPNIHLVGASGGDFCLVTTVLAGVVLNCDSMNIVGALIRVVLFGGYIVAEGYMSLKRFNDGDHQISWAAHLGGAVTGLLIGTVVLRNMDIKVCINVVGFKLNIFWDTNFVHSDSILSGNLLNVHYFRNARMSAGYCHFYFSSDIWAS